MEDIWLSKYIVITSIHGVTDSILKYAQMEQWHVILVGDRKTPALDRHPHPNITFLSVEEQAQLGLASYSGCPFNHYSRKNLGYLYAIREGAEVIADADDDNMPYPNWEQTTTLNLAEMDMISGSQYANVYRCFTDDFVWPRGYPLSAVLNGRESRTATGVNPNVMVVQGLVDGDPDVDAIYRLTVAKSIRWRKRAPVVLDRGTYCPINSQNTVWAREAFPYLYLPTTVTFRFTDILRGYVSQPGVWSRGGAIAFTSPSVRQDRNTHNLKADFEDEIPCYTQVERLISVLNSADFSGTPGKDLSRVYDALHASGIVAVSELDAVMAWVRDMQGTAQLADG